MQCWKAIISQRQGVSIHSNAESTMGPAECSNMSIKVSWGLAKQGVHYFIILELWDHPVKLNCKKF